MASLPAGTDENASSTSSTANSGNVSTSHDFFKIVPELQQAAASPPPEPPFRTAMIHRMNTQMAKRLTGIYVRIPQPSPQGHIRFYPNVTWTSSQRDRFLRDQTLPYDISTIPQAAQSLSMNLWIFDGRGSNHLHPLEIEMNPLPDFERWPAGIVIDVGLPEYMALIPPGVMRLEVVGVNKGRLVMNPNVRIRPG